MTQQQKSEPITNKIEFGEIRLNTAKQLANLNQIAEKDSYLHNFLEPFESFIKKLITKLSLVNNNSNANFEIANHILEIVRHSSEADFVFVLCNQNQDNWSVKSHSEFGDDIDQNAYWETLKSSILPTISLESVFKPAYHGTYKVYEHKKDIFKAFVLVPLQLSTQAEFMVVCGLPSDSYLLTEVYGRILSSFYQACKNLSLQPTLH